MSDEQSLLDLIALLYQAPQDAAVWPVFLEAYAKKLGAVMTATQVHYFARNTSEILANFGIASPIRSSYNAHYSALNVFRSKGRHLYVPGRVVFDQQFCSRQVFEASEFYNDFMRPLDAVYSSASTIERNADRAVVITALRGRRQRQWEESDLRTMRRVLPHVARARALEERLRLLAAGLGALDSLLLGVVLVRAPDSIVFANAAAEQVLRRADGLVSTRGRLQATDAASEAVLLHAIRLATSSPPPAAFPGALHIARHNRSAPYQVTVSCLPNAPLAASGLPTPHAMLVIQDPDRVSDVPRASLESLYGLTRREADIASALARQLSLRDAAGELGLAYETARSHLRRVFEKTGVRRQSDLVRLLAQLAAHTIDPTV